MATEQHTDYLLSGVLLENQFRNHTIVYSRGGQNNTFARDEITNVDWECEKRLTHGSASVGRNGEA